MTNKIKNEEGKGGVASKKADSAKPLFTKEEVLSGQIKDPEAFHEELKKGENEIAFVASSETLGGAVQQAKEHLKSLTHDPHGHNEVHCTGCDGKLDIPEDSKTGEIAICKDCGEAYEIIKKEGSVVVVMGYEI